MQLSAAVGVQAQGEWKWLESVSAQTTCDGTATLVNGSRVANGTDTLAPDQTTWDLFGDEALSGTPFLSLTDDSTTVDLSTRDTVWARMTTSNIVADTTFDTVLCLIVRHTPEVYINGFRYVSLGTRCDLTASSNIACTFQWSTTAGSVSGGIPAGPRLREFMTTSPVTYYICATSMTGCSVWDSVTLYAGLRDTNLAGLFSRINIDTLLCMDQTATVSIGHAESNHVVVLDQRATLSHPGRVFLPDGIPCDGRCTYRSPVTFDNFVNGQTVSSVEEIVYVSLNIEHSFIGDLYIGITCPNGQHATLMRFDGLSSPCLDTIPLSSRNWLSGSNVTGGTYFGIPDPGNASGDAKCDSTHADNAPGTGWNYCWSNNTTAGITYAPGDGIIYRSGNINNPYNAIDSSNVAAKTRFYHPDQSFASLIGCPLNGEWAIEVIDGFSGDNGYIFDWELSLDASLNLGNITIIGSNVVGDSVNRLNDSTFVLSAPAGITSDTTIPYIIQLYDSLGVVADTMVNIHYMATQYRLEHHEACFGDTIWIDGEAFAETTHRFDTVLSAMGCADVTEIDIIIHPTYAIYDTAYFCPQAPIVWRDRTFEHWGDTIFRDFTKPHCDSITFLTLAPLDSGFHAMMAISDDNITWSSDTMLAGCLVYEVTAEDRSPLGADRTWLLGDGAASTDSIARHGYDSAGVYDITLMAVSIHGCRDTMLMKDAVWVYDHADAAFSWNPENPVMSHPSAELINESEPADMYQWSIQRTDGMGSDILYGNNPTYTWGDGSENNYGEYSVTLTTFLLHITPYGDSLYCRDSIQHGITIVNDWLQFPNLVTPDGDGTNDTWRVVNLLECGMYSMNELWIYDHWGAPVYHVRNIRNESDFWDPNATRCPDGTYYFRFSAKSPYGIVRRNGTIEVIRKRD